MKSSIWFNFPLSRVFWKKKRRLGKESGTVSKVFSPLEKFFTPPMDLIKNLRSNDRRLYSTKKETRMNSKWILPSWTKESPLIREHVWDRPNLRFPDDHSRVNLFWNNQNRTATFWESLRIIMMMNWRKFRPHDSKVSSINEIWIIFFSFFLDI